MKPIALYRLCAIALLYTGCFQLGPICCVPRNLPPNVSFGPVATFSFEGQQSLHVVSGEANIVEEFHPGEHSLAIGPETRVEGLAGFTTSSGPEYLRLLVRCDPATTLTAFERVVDLPPDAGFPDVHATDAHSDVARDAHFDAFEEDASASDGFDDGGNDAELVDAASEDSSVDASAVDAGVQSGAVVAASVPVDGNWQLRTVYLRGNGPLAPASTDVCRAYDALAAARVTSWWLEVHGAGGCRVDDVEIGINGPLM